MPRPVWFTALPYADNQVANICQCIPGNLLVPGRHQIARDALRDLARRGKGGLLPQRLTSAKPDVLASLWFVDVAQRYHHVFKDHGEWADGLLPACKGIVQTLLTGTRAVQMDDGAALACKDGPCAVDVNALWYAALAMIAAQPRSDRLPDHCERLAGRLRRTIAKLYWCPLHNLPCGPAALQDPMHARCFPALDPRALLLACLDHSPLPRTRQTQIVEAFRRLVAPQGMRVPGARDATSPLYLAWWIDSLLRTAEQRRDVLSEAQAALMALPADAVAAAYRHGHAVGKPDGPTSAEIARVRRLVEQA